MVALFILGFFLITMLVVYFTPKLWFYTLVGIAYFGITYHLCYQHSHLVLWYTCVLIFGVFSLFFNIVPLRRKVLSKRYYAKAKKILPHISKTEKLALNAGGSWFEKEIFQGSPNFKKLHKGRKFSLTDEEQNFLDNETTKLCSMLDDWQINHHDRDLPENVWNFIKKNGFLGLVIDKEYGGLGFSACAHSAIVTKIATKSTTAAVTVMVPNSLGPGELLHNYGTKEQKEYYLPRLASGKEIPCFALTGPYNGSDATAIPDTGTVCYDTFEGREVLGIRLQNIEKRYITLAPVATLIGLAFQLYDPNNLLDGVGEPGITCVLLPRDHKGLEIGNRLLPLNLSFMNGTIRIKDSFIPIDYIIGGQQLAGQGWKMLVECLSIGRSISLPACGTANALLSTLTTSAYAQIREQFHLSIGSFEGVSSILAKMGGITYLMNATRQYTVTAVDAGIRPSVASAITKYHLTELGRVVVNHAMDIHAGRGIIMGPNNYLGDIYQGVPVGITVEGANILSRTLLIFGQGVMQCHPHLRNLYESLEKENGLKQFDHELFAQFGYMYHNKIRALFQAFTLGAFNHGYHSKFKRYYQHITRLSSAFAYVSDVVLILLGGELKRKEQISARLGDVMSYLYMATSVLKYFKDNGEPKSDEVFVRWSVQYALYTSQQALFGVLDNFPRPFIGKLLKISLFPYGAQFKKPSDKLEHMVSQNLLNNSETRKMIKNICFAPEDMKDPVGKMEQTFMAMLQASDAKAKIRHAIHSRQIPSDLDEMKVFAAAKELGVIDSKEYDLLEIAHKYSHEAIQVDEFTKEDLQVITG